MSHFGSNRPSRRETSLPLGSLEASRLSRRLSATRRSISRAETVLKSALQPARTVTGNPNRLCRSVVDSDSRARSSVRKERRTSNPTVVGSNPIVPACCREHSVSDSSILRWDLNETEVLREAQVLGRSSQSHRAHAKTIASRSGRNRGPIRRHFVGSKRSERRPAARLKPGSSAQSPTAESARTVAPLSFPLFSIRLLDYHRYVWNLGCSRFLEEGVGGTVVPNCCGSVSRFARNAPCRVSPRGQRRKITAPRPRPRPRPRLRTHFSVEEHEMRPNMET